MSRMIDTTNIRAGARNFSVAAHEMHGNAKRLDQIYQNLSSGQNGWTGEGAESFQTVNDQMRDDCLTAANAFERTSSVLSTLAGMFDQVNHLRQQADYLDRQIDSLEGQLWGAEESRKASLRSEITHLRHRKSSLEHEADQTEYRAHAAASSQFHQIEAMANRLHYGSGGSAQAEEGGLLEKAKNFLGGLWDTAKDAADEIGDKVEEFGEFLETKAGGLEHLVEEKMDEWLDDEFEYFAQIAWGNFGDFAEGAVCAYVNNMTFGVFEEALLEDEGQSSAYYLGRIVGDAAAAGTGAEMVNVGAGAVAGGLGEAAITASGVVSAPLAVPGLAVAVVGGVAAAYGAGASAKAVESGVKDWQLFQKSLGEGGAVSKPPQAPRKPVKDVIKQVKNEDGSTTYTMKTNEGRVVDVRYSKDGYPDFSSFEYRGSDGKAVVEIEYSGKRSTDFKRANEAAGFEKTPTGYTWHHAEDGKTMQLVESDVHEKFQHTGGMSTNKHKKP